MADFDVVVIGSGFGGAVAACRLAEAGSTVLVLERGRRWKRQEYPSVSRDDWIWDDDNPHQANGWFDIRLFNTISTVAGAGVGGGSLHYANVLINATPDLFEDGWPEEITFAELRNCHKITFASRIVFTYSGRVSEPAAIKRRYEALRGVLDERSRRLLVAAESLALGRGGISAVARATGVSRQVIARGRQELTEPAGPPPGRIRRRGGGRKRSVTKDPTLKSELERLVEPLTRGDPESPLRWTLKSVRKLAAELERRGHPTSHRMVAELLHQLGYRLQANRKTKEGTKHPDRNAQFEQINRKVKRFLAHRQPAISVDTKKRELVGDFKNNGRELRPKGDPEKVRVHDFPIPELGRATPYGVYDMARNRGWVSVGVDHDTAAFAVETIRRWWRSMGQAAYPQAKRLLITADAGGSNGSRPRLWKLELQKLADETGLRIAVCHFPPGTSKWNKIEHRLFSYISQNWRGKPLISHEVIVNLIAATTTRTGLQVHAELDTGSYPTGIKITHQQMAALKLRRDKFHGEWNYTLLPRKTID